jgi:uncharacterized protein DUF6915
VRFVGEQHVKEDLGGIPTLQDWFRHLRLQPWMARGGDRQAARGEEPANIPTNLSPRADSMARPPSS